MKADKFKAGSKLHIDPMKTLDFARFLPSAAGAGGGGKGKGKGTESIFCDVVGSLFLRLGHADGWIPRSSNKFLGVYDVSWRSHRGTQPPDAIPINAH